MKRPAKIWMMIAFSSHIGAEAWYAPSEGSSTSSWTCTSVGYRGGASSPTAAPTAAHHSAEERNRNDDNHHHLHSMDQDDWYNEEEEDDADREEPDDEEEEENVYEEAEETPRVTSAPRRERFSVVEANPHYDARKRRPSPEALVVNSPESESPPRISRRRSSARSSADWASWTAHLATATLRQSGRVVTYLARPKHVQRHELLGAWRLDQQIDPAAWCHRPGVPWTCAARLEFTAAGQVGVQAAANNKAGAPTTWTFTPANWGPLVQAQVEFTARAFAFPSSSSSLQEEEDLDHVRPLLMYRGYVERKWAASQVLKLKGRIYRIIPTGWRGQQVRYEPVGTFVARRRLPFTSPDNKSSSSSSSYHHQPDPTSQEDTPDDEEDTDDGDDYQDDDDDDDDDDEFG